MATVDEVALVRAYADEPTQDNWTDAALSDLIDGSSVEEATSRVWTEKMARYSKLVDVSEAGASRKMSQAYDHAKEMAAYWAGVVAEGSGSASYSWRSSSKLEPVACSMTSIVADALENALVSRNSARVTSGPYSSCKKATK